jgi:hypothetical protein
LKLNFNLQKQSKSLLINETRGSPTGIGGTMKKILITTLIVLVLLATVGGVAYAAAGTTNPQVLSDLAKVRRVTAKYHDVNAALADGYAATDDCDASPDGGMGYHYVNPTLAMDADINLLTPEILMYEDSDDGLRLVGVEYFLGIGAPDSPVPDPAPPAPVLFGLPFDGPMLGHIPGMPPHYDLHVWIWKSNPNGMFAMWNPNVTCP